MADISGDLDPRFAAVRDALAASLDGGRDVGASVAVVHEGRLVVDLWGGWADEARTTPWQRDTITNVWSTTKTMMALVCLVLIERGELDPGRRVADYWPEFAAQGKQDVRVSHLLSHSSGVSGWEAPITATDLEDFERCATLLAGQAPWWEPGTASGYHAVTQGFLLGEVVRRITGTTLGRFLATEIAGPLGADFHIGTAPEHFARISDVIPPPPLAPPAGVDPASVAVRTLTNPPMRGEMANTEGWRRAEIGAANGHGNARSVATLQGLVANGGELDGTRLLSEATIARIFEEQVRGTDLVLGVPLRLGLGYGLTSDELPVGPNPHTCFWGGWGGSLVVVDTDAHLAFAYVMNKMGEGTLGDDRGASMLVATYASLG